MEKEYATRIKLLKIWEILTHYSDIDEPISSTEILAKLAENGINCDRRTLYGDIQLLTACGYCVKTVRRKTNLYYTDSSKFTMLELKAVIDAVFNDKNIPISQSKKIIEKLYLNAETEYKLAENRKSKPVSISKAVDMALYENLITIDTAIEANKKLSYRTFNYNLRKERVASSEKKVASPRFIINENGEYYLVLADELQNFDVVCVKYICNLAVEKENREEFASCDKLRKLAVEKICGKMEYVTFICENSALNAVIEKFGFLINLSRQGENKFSLTVNVAVNETLFAWVVSTCGKVHINAPLKVKEKFKNFINKIGSDI